MRTLNTLQRRIARKPFLVDKQLCTNSLNLKREFSFKSEEFQHWETKEYSSLEDQICFYFSQLEWIPWLLFALIFGYHLTFSQSFNFGLFQCFKKSTKWLISFWAFSCFHFIPKFYFKGIIFFILLKALSLPS